MGRHSAIAKIFVAAGFVCAVWPASAQFNSIFRDEPLRPPASIPNDDSTPQIIQQEQAPPRPQFPAETRRAPDRQPPPAGMLPPRAAPTTVPRDAAIQSQPLPPPPGANSAPAEAALPAPPPSGQKPNSEPMTPGQQPDLDTSLPPHEVVVEPPPNPIANPTAVFAGLDKITGRITSFDVAIGETVQFGALRVTPHVCYSRPPTESPRTDAFIDVDEVTLTGKVKRIFTGWMFASSPGLHAVEHPIYDVWLTDCKGGKLDIAEGEKTDTVPRSKPVRRPARRP